MKATNTSIGLMKKNGQYCLFNEIKNHWDEYCWVEMKSSMSEDDTQMNAQVTEMKSMDSVTNKLINEIIKKSLIKGS